MKIFTAGLGLALACSTSGFVNAFIPGGSIVAAGGSSSKVRSPLSRVADAATVNGVGRSAIACPISGREQSAWGQWRSASATSLSVGRDGEDSGRKARSVDGVGGFGSNVLLIVAAVLVTKGLLLPEEIRHLSFCPSEDPVRGRDTLPWRMMEESGRQCGSIPEVAGKYLTSPIAFPGTPEWGEMLNVKEDAMRDQWLQ